MRYRLAILDDYLDCAQKLADWSAVEERADITVFTTAFESREAVRTALAEFDIVCLMRDRTPVDRTLVEALPKLKLLTYTAPVNGALDLEAATNAGIAVCNTGSRHGLEEHAEFIWAFLLATARNFAAYDAAMRQGHWQTGFATAIHGKTLGILGLGNFGSRMAGFARAFGMDVLAWSQNLTEEKAAQHGARKVELDDLLASSDIITTHLVLSARTRGLIGAREFALMKPTAIFLNTSRGPIVDEAALIDALQTRRITRAGLDVFEHEPLAVDSPLRQLDNVLLSPHMGFVTQDLLRCFYEQTVEDVLAWMDGTPIRLANPDVYQRS